MDEDVTLEIKLAAEDDAADVLAFLRQSKTESDAVTIPHLEKVTSREEADNIKVINESDDCIMMLAMAGSEIAGMVTVMRLPDEESTGELGVIIAKKYWHQGIGQLLVDEAKYWFSNYSNLERLTLDVFADNMPAINLYRKMNFVSQGHRSISGRDAIQMDYLPKLDEK